MGLRLLKVKPKLLSLQQTRFITHYWPASSIFPLENKGSGERTVNINLAKNRDKHLCRNYFYFVKKFLNELAIIHKERPENRFMTVLAFPLIRDINYTENIIP